MVGAYPPIAELLPHAGAMVLLDEMTAWADGAAQCTLTVRAGAPFVRDGGVTSAATIEYMAQAVAASFGYAALLGGAGVRVGMIIGCKRFSAHRERLEVGERARVDVKRIQGNDTLSHFECKLWTGSALFAEAVLTLYHAEQPPLR
jgi:predicted hotdog family 3-hydroxylacyl-ACP dehydratase